MTTLLDSRSSSYTLRPYAELYETYLELMPDHQARIRGTDLTAGEVRERLASGEGLQVLSTAYPTVAGDAFKVAIAYATDPDPRFE